MSKMKISPRSKTGPGPGFGVYLHWPFCLSKFPYCDFNSHVRAKPIDEIRFVDAFRAELAHRAGLTPGRTLSSIFFGGGTPSLMTPATVGAILDAIAGFWPVAQGAEVTLEANPTSVEAEQFAASGRPKSTASRWGFRRSMTPIFGRSAAATRRRKRCMRWSSRVRSSSATPSISSMRGRSDGGRLAPGACRSHRPRPRPSLALSTHYRIWHHVRAAARRGKTRSPR